MKCPRCLNEQRTYFYKGSKGYYCRKCIQFKRILLSESLEAVALQPVHSKSSDFYLPFSLTPLQKIMSERCLQHILEKNVFIHAVTGAGKTEIVIESIAHFLSNQKKVAFVIPRRQVVIELTKRFQNIFKNAKVICVCAGYTTELDGDLILMTSHQCYRYYQAFDLVVLDEFDAYPLKGNQTLFNIVKTSCKGNIIYLSATEDKKIVKSEKCEILRLYKRPHGHPLIVPKTLILPELILWLSLLKFVLTNDKPCIVFVPTIVLANILKMLLGFIKRVKVVHSQCKDNEKTIMDLKNKKIDCIVSTTVLERGVTIENVSVCVLYADHRIFDEASLIQIAGRVGRSVQYFDGICLFLCRKFSKHVQKCVQTIKEANNA